MNAAEMTVREYSALPDTDRQHAMVTMSSRTAAIMECMAWAEDTEEDERLGLFRVVPQVFLA